MGPKPLLPIENNKKHRMRTLNCEKGGLVNNHRSCFRRLVLLNAYQRALSLEFLSVVMCFSMLAKEHCWLSFELSSVDLCFSMLTKEHCLSSYLRVDLCFSMLAKEHCFSFELSFVRLVLLNAC